MSWLDTFRTGFEAIRTHRLRSVLTMLGILIGIAAVILTVGLGEGAQAQVGSEISSLGTNLLVVSPGSTTSATGVRGGLGTASTLTAADATALGNRAVVPDVAAVAPSTSQSETVLAGSANWTTSVIGTTPSWLRVRGRTLAAGRFLSAADERADAAVAVLGPTTASELFGARSPIGSSVTVLGVPFTVVGELTSAGAASTASSAAANLDDEVIVPLSTAAARLFGGSATSVQSIDLEATSASTISAAYQEATAELDALHGITNPANADFTIATQQSLLSTATSVDKTLTVLLGGIAAISLLVGGIGVMNIMLVSVTERTREIGVRKAMGATKRTILLQFTIEAITLCSVGGLIGVLVGGILTLAVRLIFPTIPAFVSAFWAVLGFSVSCAIGLIFGIYPAWKAANLDPIEALRYE